ncbi:hypothetical protein C5N14_31095 [Micromonospora sp. MW-13]|nr:hypothetical protein C5N14_31095 [Micromonospora sp. MW-13]
MYQVTKSFMNVRAWARDANRSGNTGAYFNVLNQASLYGLSLDTFGRECERVTSRSSSRSATDFDVIDVPRSACTTCGTPWTSNTWRIIDSARGPDSRACTRAPTMYRE